MTAQDGYVVRSDRLLNDVCTAARDSLDGVTLLHPHIAIVDIGSTVARKDYATMETFRILAGGPTGHEPMYSGYVGVGALTAAIQGDLFKSPTTYEILNVIRELAFKQIYGVLLIIQNSSTCALNFALAVEKALTEGIHVKCLITTDEAGEPLAPHRSDQSQGLTGTLITIKVAGAMADGFGKTLNEVYTYISELQSSMSTALLVLKPCTLVVKARCVCTDSNQAHIGGGLRAATPGKNKLKCMSASNVVNEVLKELSKNIVLDLGVELIVMVNNMCCSALEENIFTSELIKKLLSLGMVIVRIYVGTFMTAVDLQGFTVTLMKSTVQLLQYLDYPTEAPSWRMRMFGVDGTLQASIKPRVRLMSYQRITPKGPSLGAREANIVTVVTQFACDALISCRQQLDIMDEDGGDGDIGQRLEHVAHTILRGFRERGINSSNMFAFFKMLSKICDGINGSLGAIFSIMFESFANTFAKCEMGEEGAVGKAVDETLWIECLQNSVISLKLYTQNEEAISNMLAPVVACAATMGEKTELDAAPLLEAFELGVMEAEDAAVKTAIVQHRKYPDPGAHAVAICLRAVYEGVKFRCQF